MPTEDRCTGITYFTQKSPSRDSNQGLLAERDQSFSYQTAGIGIYLCQKNNLNTAVEVLFVYLLHLM